MIWEYRIEFLDLSAVLSEARLNSQGYDRWELVSVTNHPTQPVMVAFFKRPKV